MDKLLTVDEVAEILQINPETVRVYARDKKIKSFSVAEKYRFKSQDVEDFIKSKANK